MGAGDFPAGAGIAGFDPVYLPVPAAAIVPPRAVKYDPSVKQFLLTDSNGNPTDVHPVDQIVALRLTSEQGQSKSVPGLGTRIRVRFQASPPSKRQQIAFDEVSTQLDDLIKAGDVLLVSVSVATNLNATSVVVASYVNLKSPKLNQQAPLQSAVNAPPITVS